MVDLTFLLAHLFSFILSCSVNLFVRHLLPEIGYQVASG